MSGPERFPLGSPGVAPSDVPLVTNRRLLGGDHFAAAKAADGTVVDVRVWVERDDLVLLVCDRDVPGTWIEPGGTPSDADVEGAGTARCAYRRTARREVAEETGIDCSITGLRGVVRHERICRPDPAAEAVLYQLFYRAEYDGGSLDPSPD